MAHMCPNAGLRNMGLDALNMTTGVAGLNATADLPLNTLSTALLLITGENMWVVLSVPLCVRLWQRLKLRTREHTELI